MGRLSSGPLPIGAAIVSSAGTLVATGRNRISAYSAAGDNERVLFGHRLAHAELNALLALPEHIDPTTCTLYTTLEPCPLCVGAIRVARIGQVKYAARDNHAGSINLFTANAYMRWEHVTVIRPPHPQLETVLLALLLASPQVREKRAKRIFTMYTRNAAHAPQSAFIAELLVETGELATLVNDQCPADTVYDHIAMMTW